MRTFTVDDFKLGLNTSKPADKLEQGEASDALNWLAKDGFIELSGGSKLIGDTTFSGFASGLFSSVKTDGTLVAWLKVGAKLYAKDGDADWAEVGTDLLDGAADGFASFAEWKGITGQWVFVSAAGGGLHKLSVALPTSYVSYPDCGFSGDLAVIQNRLWVSGWPTTGGSLDLTGFQLSHQPKAALSDYTSVVSESVATGDGSDKTLSGTLDFKAGGATRNCFSVAVYPTVADLSLTVTGISKAASAVVTVTESVSGVIPSPGTFSVVLTGQGGMTEINGIPALATYISDHQFSLAIDSTGFSNWTSAGPVWKCGGTLTDSGDGTLSSTDGSTGTVNYATGAVSLTLNAAPPNGAPVPVQYLWEDSAADGLAKFSPLSSAAGDGLSHYLPQPGVGESRGVFAYGNSAFCPHSQGVYEVTFDSYGDPASNLVFRQTSGPSSKRGAAATADGIYYVDDASGKDVKLRVIRTVNSQGNLYVDNPSVSDDVDLSGYSFADASVAVKGDLVAVACASASTNDTVFLHDRRVRNFVRHSYPAKLLASYGSDLIYGDVAIGAAYTMLDGDLFSGEPRDNRWDSGDLDCGYDGLKRARHLWAEGSLAKSQELALYAKLDGGGWAEVGRVRGTDAQVDDTSSGLIGDDAIGAETIGEFTSETSYPFAVSFPWNLKYRLARLRVKAVGVGAAKVDSLTFHDVRLCGSRLPEKYRTY